MEAKLKHLEFVQNTINRMAGNSFLLKGWVITLVGALFALSLQETNYWYLLISLIVLIFFWVLDSYYLSQERSFIKLYEHVATAKGETDFSMDTKPHKGKIHWHKCAFSYTMRVFYGGLFIAHIGVLIIILIK